jgi:FAD synthase
MSRYSGVVEKGGGYGQKLGFPTANIPLTDDSISGIYAGKVFFNNEEWNAAVYADTKRRLLEAHILNFNDDLYGMEIEIELLEKVREDRSFSDEAEAQKTIREDVEVVEAYFRRVN